MTFAVDVLNYQETESVPKWRRLSNSEILLHAFVVVGESASL